MTAVQTVLGEIDSAQLGTVLSHEHVVTTLGEDNHHYPWLFDWERTRTIAVRSLSEAKAGGVDTLIDLTTPDLGRDVGFVRDVAAASGMNVVVATGIWLTEPASFWERDLDEIADIFVREIEVGIDDTAIRAGVIKVASDHRIGGVTPHGERILRGAARALKRTGCPISTHTSASEGIGARQIEIFRDEGAPMDRICIGHAADSTDVDYLESLLNAGVFLSMDRYPEPEPNWRQRNATVKALIDRGWAKRMMLGHDESPTPVRVDQETPEPDDPPPYLLVSSVAMPALREDGVGAEVIDTMLRDVPRRFLTGEGESGGATIA
jgi:phosphotriesterase-related protein